MIYWLFVDYSLTAKLLSTQIRQEEYLHFHSGRCSVLNGRVNSTLHFCGRIRAHERVCID